MTAKIPIPLLHRFFGSGLMFAFTTAALLLRSDGAEVKMQPAPDSKPTTPAAQSPATAAATSAPAENVATLEPWKVHKVRVIDGGVIEKFHFRTGDTVKENEIAVTLDNARQKHTLDVAKVRAADKSRQREASADLKIRQSTLEDLRQRLRRRQVSEHQVDQAEAQLEGGQAKLEAAKSGEQLSQLDLGAAALNYDNRFLRSPLAGVVMSVEKEEGEAVGVGTVLMTITDFSAWKTQATVTGDVAARLREGLRVPLRLASGVKEMAQIVRIIPQEDGRSIIEFVVNNPEPTQVQTPGQGEFLFSEMPQSWPGRTGPEWYPRPGGVD